MYPAILIALILLSLVGIVYALHAMAGELQDLGGDKDEDAGARKEKKKALKEIERWREGK